MARPLSTEKRQTLIDATIETVAQQGLQASTASIAKNAGVATGSLFTYFETKEILFNEVFIELKKDILQNLMEGSPKQANFQQQLQHLWQRYVDWGIKFPQKRSAVKQLEFSTLLTEKTRENVQELFAEIYKMFEQAVEFKRFFAPLSFTILIMEQLVEATILQIEADPEQRNLYQTLGFEMMWRAVVKD